MQTTVPLVVLSSETHEIRFHPSNPEHCLFVVWRTGPRPCVTEEFPTLLDAAGWLRDMTGSEVEDRLHHAPSASYNPGAAMRYDHATRDLERTRNSLDALILQLQ